jgi:hypothetical protein
MMGTCERAVKQKQKQKQKQKHASCSPTIRALNWRRAVTQP